MVLENRTNGKRYESNNSLRKERGKKSGRNCDEKLKRQGKEKILIAPGQVCEPVIHLLLLVHLSLLTKVM